MRGFPLGNGDPRLAEILHPLSPESTPPQNIMLEWTLIFLVVALIAAALGFSGVAGQAAGIAKILFVIFLIVWIVTLIL